MNHKHECHCAFCDKMMMAENLATMVCGYITCGAHNCQVKAEETTKHYMKLEAAKVEHTSRMLIFSTKTPEDDSTWRLVKQSDHPAALTDVHVMGQMKVGHYMFLEDEKMYFCAKPSHEVLKEVRENLGVANDG